MTYDSIDRRFHPQAGGEYHVNQDFWYQINGGKINPFTISRTAETHQSYYGDTSSSDATPGWEGENDLRLTVHENTNDGSYALIMVFGDADFNQPSWDFTFFFDQSINTNNIIGRDDTGDTYQSDRFVYGGGGNNTDGVIVPMSEWTDVTFTLTDRNGTIDVFQLVDDPDATQNFQGAGISGSIRIVNRS